MNNSWFRWEREAAIHLIYPTLEGSFKLLKDYIGLSIPTTVAVFKNGVSTWSIEAAELPSIQSKFLEKYLGKSKEQKMREDSKASLKKLQIIQKKLKKNLGNLTDKQLLKEYKKLYKAFVEYYLINATLEFVAWGAESALRLDPVLSDQDISILSAPKKRSFIQDAEEYLVNTKNIKGFLKKYYWVDNNYANIYDLNEGDIQKKLENLLLHKTQSKQKPIQTKLKLSKYNKRLAEILSNYTYYQDERKKNILIFLSHLNKILIEVSKRSGLSLENIYVTFPYELESVLDKQINVYELEERQKYFAIYWKIGEARPEILTGEEADKVKVILGEEDFSDIREIKGNIASRGKVIGKVRVLYSAKDCDLLEKGEILVTFMTSPDFMPAIRKSSAIITNLGGVTCHAAIISRELGIPCIIGTKIATEVLKTGDMVEVDADKGVAKKLK